MLTLHAANLDWSPSILCHSPKPCQEWSPSPEQWVRSDVIKVWSINKNMSRENQCWQRHGEKKLSFTVGINVFWINLYGQQYGDLKKVRLELPDDPAHHKNFNLKGYMDNVHRSAYYNSYGRKTTQCPITDEWIKNLWYIYTQMNTMQLFLNLAVFVK